MELDDMKQTWTAMHLRQEGMEALLHAEFRDRRMHKTHSILRWSLIARALELFAWMVFTAWAASFWFDHRHTLHWLVIGVILHVYGIAAIWGTATQWLLLARIQLNDAPVLVLQHRLAQLRRFRVWCTLGLGLPWWCLWLLVSMAGAYQLTGVDWFAASPGWIGINMAVGVAGMIGSLWLARHLATRPQRSAFVQRLIDDMSGCNLRRAERQLDELARFERE